MHTHRSLYLLNLTRFLQVQHSNLMRFLWIASLSSRISVALPQPQCNVTCKSAKDGILLKLIDEEIKHFWEHFLTFLKILLSWDDCRQKNVLTSFPTMRVAGPDYFCLIILASTTERQLLSKILWTIWILICSPFSRCQSGQCPPWEPLFSTCVFLSLFQQDLSTYMLWLGCLYLYPLWSQLKSSQGSSI